MSETYFLDCLSDCLYNKKASRAIGWQDRETYAELAPAGLTKERQVLDMDAYQIIMICIASVTLVLKLIELYHNISRK